jgi:predicted nucleic acid-binding protein
MIYLDTSCLTKIYTAEPGSAEVIVWMTGKSDFVSCLHGRLELVSSFKRHQREGHLTQRDVTALIRRLEADETAELIAWLPCEAGLVQAACARTASLPPSVFLRAGDSLHLACAADAGLKEIYSHDRHLLAAAPHFGLKGIDVIKTP